MLKQPASVDNTTLKSLRRAALALLARRDYTQQELVQKLHDKGFAADHIALIVAELVTASFLNDQRFTQNYIRYKRNQGYGPKYIQRALQTRGIAAAVIADELNIADNSWLTDIRRLWQKRFKGHHPTDYKQRAKQMRFLYARGFTAAQIESIYNE